MTTTDKTLDITGLSEERQKAVTERTLDAMQRGQVLRVVTNERSMRLSIPGLCEQRGYALIEIQEDERALSFFIRK
jgi:TusA-related sulfurtransferase